MIELLSLITGIVGLGITFYQLIINRRSNIFFIIDSNINLYKDVANNIEGLEVKYLGLPISENSHLVTGFICYTGKNDLDNKEKKDLSLLLPERSEIFHYRSLYMNGGFDLKVAPLTNIINFNFDLLKDKEFLHFEFFSNIPNPNKIKFKHRFTNIDNVIIKNYGELPRWQKKYYAIYTFVLAITYFIFFYFYYGIVPNDNKPKSYYNFEKIYYNNNKQINIDSTLNALNNKIYIFETNLSHTNKPLIDSIIFTRNSINNLKLVQTMSDSILQAELKAREDAGIFSGKYEIFPSSNISPKFSLSRKFHVQFIYNNPKLRYAILATIIINCILLLIHVFFYIRNRDLEKIYEEIEEYKYFELKSNYN